MVFERRGRDRVYIIAEVLSVAKDGSLKTQIMYRANLSFTQLNEYLSFLLKIKLLKVNEENGKTFYKTTPKGMKYLEAYKTVLELVERPELESEIRTSLL